MTHFGSLSGIPGFSTIFLNFFLFKSLYKISKSLIFYRFSKGGVLQERKTITKLIKMTMSVVSGTGIVRKRCKYVVFVDYMEYLMRPNGDISLYV